MSPGRPRAGNRVAAPPAGGSAKAPVRSSSPIVTLPLPILLGVVLGLAALGFAVGAVDAFMQARTLEIGVRLPVGAVLAVAVLGGVALSAGLCTRSRIGLGVVALGWVVSVVLFTSPRAEGDVIVAADVPGYLYLFGGVLMLAALSAIPFAALGGADKP